MISKHHWPTNKLEKKKKKFTSGPKLSQFESIFITAENIMQTCHNFMA